MAKTEAQLVEELRTKAIARTQVYVAEELGVTPQYLHDILKGLRPLSDRVATAMGYTRKVTFERLK